MRDERTDPPEPPEPDGGRPDVADPAALGPRDYHLADPGAGRVHGGPPAGPDGPPAEVHVEVDHYYHGGAHRRAPSVREELSEFFEEMAASDHPVAYFLGGFAVFVAVIGGLWLFIGLASGTWGPP